MNFQVNEQGGLSVVAAKGPESINIDLQLMPQDLRDVPHQGVVVPGCDGQHWAVFQGGDLEANGGFLKVYPETGKQKPDYSFRGQLAYSRGILTVPAIKGVYTGEIGNRLGVTVLSSPVRFTNFQQALGQKPQEDAFQLTPIDSDRGDNSPLRAGQIVEGAASWKLSIAGYKSPGFVIHDLTPSDHIFGWLCMPTGQRAMVREQAHSLTYKYGDSIHADDATRPSEVVEFARGMDNWRTVIGFVFWGVQKTVMANSPEKFLQELEQLDAEISDGWQMKLHGRAAIDGIGSDIHNLRRIGVIDNQSGDDIANGARQRTLREVAAHIADIFLRLERNDTASVSDETLEGRNARIDAATILRDYYLEKAIA